MNIFTGHYASLAGKAYSFKVDLDDIRFFRGHSYLINIENNMIISTDSFAAVESGLQAKLLELYPELFI